MDSSFTLRENCQRWFRDTEINVYCVMNASSNTQISTTGASSHEIENAGGSYPNSVVSKTRSNASGQEFDDIVVWLSPNMLFNRLVAANKLP